ncbi:single-stranded-DNA-specific exonuclease [Alkalibaculum bacchi]|uniref:Single-stranded-DNA-specific exonuclease RecJ n=1 Tax=Alkalibaculum bacchi TaxID=645887 RepID=A0A366IE31_9FIRM|nr:single-stranded-DNA-specific exonuclease RecJ [Alkalibaculum bacchi]RBP68343.1 single-stranded-DNA-specific exonuclease [Alkalibaculum bacchi]
MYRWTLKNRKVDYKNMSSQLRISQEVCRVLVNRNITSRQSIKEYLHPTFENLHDPRLMLDLEKSVNAIIRGIQENKLFRIVSDYDVDGVISCYTLYKALSRCGARVDYVIPHRVYDGYGINERIVRDAKEDGIDILITCDNGISAFDAMELASELGLIVIITDHHQLSYEVFEDGSKEYQKPKAYAIVNPHQEDCKYPFKSLCGAGVVFKMIQLLYELMNLPKAEALDFVQYTAIATVCDIVDLVGENRIIVKNGLELLKSTENVGVKELIKVNNQDIQKISAYTLGFIIGPCINAAGRLDSSDIAVELLITDDEDEAIVIASELYQFNYERKELTESGLEKVIFEIENSQIKDDKIKIIFQEDIHESVAGIIAGRVKDIYHLPTIVLTDSEGIAKGSGRSIEAYNIYEGLSSCRELLEKFGGHSMAAGLSVQKSNIQALRQKINEQFDIDEEELIPKLNIDAFMSIDQVNLALINELEFLEPFGKGNSKPVFGDKNIGLLKGRILGEKGNVLSLKLVSSNKELHDGIFFGDIKKFNEFIEEKFGRDELDKLYNGMNNRILLDMAYYPKLNSYNGNEKIQINILHMK